MPDITIRNEGTIFLFCPNTERGKLWIRENVAGEALYFGRALVVEHRYARDLAEGMIGDGLVVR
jgi:hypothetical protein